MLVPPLKSALALAVLVASLHLDAAPAPVADIGGLLSTAVGDVVTSVVAPVVAPATTEPAVIVSSPAVVPTSPPAPNTPSNTPVAVPTPTDTPAPVATPSTPSTAWGHHQKQNNNGSGDQQAVASPAAPAAAGAPDAASDVNAGAAQAQPPAFVQNNGTPAPLANVNVGAPSVIPGSPALKPSGAAAPAPAPAGASPSAKAAPSVAAGSSQAAAAPASGSSNNAGPSPNAVSSSTVSNGSSSSSSNLTPIIATTSVFLLVVGAASMLFVRHRAAKRKNRVSIDAGSWSAGYGVGTSGSGTGSKHSFDNRSVATSSSRPSSGASQGSHNWGTLGYNFRKSVVPPTPLPVLRQSPGLLETMEMAFPRADIQLDPLSHFENGYGHPQLQQQQMRAEPVVTGASFHPPNPVYAGPMSPDLLFETVAQDMPALAAAPAPAVQPPAPIRRVDSRKSAGSATTTRDSAMTVLTTVDQGGYMRDRVTQKHTSIFSVATRAANMEDEDEDDEVRVIEEEVEDDESIAPPQARTVRMTNIPKSSAQVRNPSLSMADNARASTVSSASSGAFSLSQYAVGDDDDTEEEDNGSPVVASATAAAAAHVARRRGSILSTSNEGPSATTPQQQPAIASRVPGPAAGRAGAMAPSTLLFALNEPAIAAYDDDIESDMESSARGPISPVESMASTVKGLNVVAGATSGGQWPGSRASFDSDMSV
ncbi:hypothetical protein HK101_008377 [Irineochytrium annulatum]|nr:hypothetical protein HK101_008377 [Irineochytrium annulatum]